MLYLRLSHNGKEQIKEFSINLLVFVLFLSIVAPLIFFTLIGMIIILSFNISFILSSNIIIIIMGSIGWIITIYLLKKYVFKWLSNNIEIIKGSNNIEIIKEKNKE